MAHQGQALRQLISRSNYSVEDVTKMLNVTRRTAYLWFEKEVLREAIVDRVANAIGVDVHKTMPGVFGRSETIRWVEAKESKEQEMIDYWRNKYLTLVRENDLLREKIKSLEGKKPS